MPFIDGFAIAGYRSFGADIQYISPCKHINLLVGPNNSGKSNILRLLAKHYPQFASGDADVRPSLNYQADLHRKGDDISHSPNGNLQIGLGTRSKSAMKQIHRLVEAMSAESVKDAAVELFESDKCGCVWRLRGLYPDGNVGPFMADIPPSWVSKFEHQWRELASQLNVGHNAENYIGAVNALFDYICDMCAIHDNHRELDVVMIPAERSSHAPVDFHSGESLARRLAQLENPDWSERHLRDKFDEITEFVRDVTGFDSAILSIPASREGINVSIDGKYLPLESLGTGICQVVLLASAVTVLSDQVVCIEEPESHLHPMLQRKLLRYLAKTNNQYFIATHSPHVLDSTDSAVFRVSHDGVQSRVSHATSRSEQWRICKELGCRPSDVIQANCVVWVEGPSDRIYVKHWIDTACRDGPLTEGIHYQIMFYGGRLLSHLSADDDEIGEFISLCELNRNVVIIMDSDKSRSDSDLNATKRRIQAEIENRGHGIAWVTAGREIENYVPTNVLRRAVESVAPGMGKRVGNDPYKHVLPYLDDRETRTVDKVKVSREVADIGAGLDVLDLGEKVDDLVRFIREANH